MKAKIQQDFHHYFAATKVLMDSDPGLRRRFSLVLQLEDYSAQELAEICILADS